VNFCIFKRFFTVNTKSNNDRRKRQTIPAFRMREKWMIAEEFIPTETKS
jgi:hypothetical protein